MREEQLITPHGDRKPDTLNPAIAGNLDSLPLMGIENPIRRQNVTVCGTLWGTMCYRGRATQHHCIVSVRLSHGVQRVLCSGARRSQTSDQFFPCH